MVDNFFRIEEFLFYFYPSISLQLVLLSQFSKTLILLGPLDLALLVPTPRHCPHEAGAHILEVHAAYLLVKEFLIEGRDVRFWVFHPLSHFLISVPKLLELSDYIFVVVLHAALLLGG